jgi:hypothetical protein
MPLAKTVIPGNTPFCQLAPLSLEVAKAMPEAPASKNRPIWNTATRVEPKPAIEGSTSVACWLVLFEKMSVLSLRSKGGGLLVPLPPFPEFAPDPQARFASSASAAQTPAAMPLPRNLFFREYAMRITVRFHFTTSMPESASWQRS